MGFCPTYHPFLSQPSILRSYLPSLFISALHIHFLSTILGLFFPPSTQSAFTKITSDFQVETLSSFGLYKFSFGLSSQWAILQMLMFPRIPFRVFLFLPIKLYNLLGQFYVYSFNCYPDPSDPKSASPYSVSKT